MKSKYYIGKAMKKISNYKSPYREYFNEIAGFTQSSIDHFTNKRRNSRMLSKPAKKRENYEEAMKNSRIAEDPEEVDPHRKSTNPKSKKDYKIIVNNLEYESKKKSSASQSPRMIKHDYNIFINNITFQEIESGKRREVSYHEKFAKLSEKKPKESEENEGSERKSEEESPKKYKIKVSPVLLEAETKKCEIIQKNPSFHENIARLSKVEKMPVFRIEDEGKSDENTQNIVNMIKSLFNNEFSRKK